jgi:hypothetical protein
VALKAGLNERHDIQHNDTQHNDIQHNNITQHKGLICNTQHKNTLYPVTLCAECRDLLIVMLNVIVLSVIMLNVVAPFE